MRKSASISLLVLLLAITVASATAIHAKAVTDGYWILLKPPLLGKHTVCFAAEGANGFLINITYRIIVVWR